MLTYIFSASDRFLSEAAMKTESHLEQSGARVLLLSSRHLGKLESTDVSVQTGYDAIIIDEAHLCSRAQAAFIRRLSSEHDLTVFCYGLRTDAQGDPYEGSIFLMAWCDEIRSLDPAHHRKPERRSFRAADAGRDERHEYNHSGAGRDEHPLYRSSDMERDELHSYRTSGTGRDEHPSYRSSDMERYEHHSYRPSDIGRDEPAQQADSYDDEPEISPILLSFLDAKSPVQRLRILKDNREKIDEQMLGTIAAVLDIELCDGDFERRFYDIQSCLETIVKYEKERISL